VPDFNCGKGLQLQLGIERAQTGEQLEIPLLAERGMQPADHVHFGDAAGQRFSHRGDDLIDRAFKSMWVALLRGKGAELAGEDADIGIVDVTIKDVGRDVTVLPLAHGAGHDPESVEVIRSVELERLLIRDPLIQIDLLSDCSECRWN
jgi:hypothetical protein